MNIAVITGASSGIGREFAIRMDEIFEKIDEFWLVARSRDKLEELSGKLKHRARVFAMDITDEDRLDDLCNAVREERAIVRVLVNCAGYGIMGAFSAQPEEAELGMIRLNCEALTSMTYRLIPYMKKNSRIIQLASSAAFLPQPDFAVYAASKAYVLSFSRALGEELSKRQIYVTSVCPGPVDTPFFEIAEKNGSTLSLKKYTMVTAKRVVGQALRDSHDKRTMSVCSLPIRGFWVLAKVVPHKVILDFMRYM